MKMNLTLIALAAAAVFDASDIGTSHSVARDAGLGCSALMLKRRMFNRDRVLTEEKRKVLETDMIAYLSLVLSIETHYNIKRPDILNVVIPTEDLGAQSKVNKFFSFDLEGALSKDVFRKEVVESSLNGSYNLPIQKLTFNQNDVGSVILRAHAVYREEFPKIVFLEKKKQYVHRVGRRNLAFEYTAIPSIVQKMHDSILKKWINAVKKLAGSSLEKWKNDHRGSGDIVFSNEKAATSTSDREAATPSALMLKRGNFLKKMRGNSNSVLSEDERMELEKEMIISYSFYLRGREDPREVLRIARIPGTYPKIQHLLTITELNQNDVDSFDRDFRARFTKDLGRVADPWKKMQDSGLKKFNKAVERLEEDTAKKAAAAVTTSNKLLINNLLTKPGNRNAEPAVYIKPSVEVNPVETPPVKSVAETLAESEGPQAEPKSKTSAHTHDPFSHEALAASLD